MPCSYSLSLTFPYVRATNFVKVFVIVRKARFKSVWHNRDQYSVSIEVIDGGCGPASMFTSSTVNDLDTCINEHSLLLYKRVKHNDDVADGPKLKISLNKSSGMATHSNIYIHFSPSNITSYFLRLLFFIYTSKESFIKNDTSPISWYGSRDGH